MKLNPFRPALRFVLLNTALVGLAVGCASPNEHSYNDDYNQNLPTAPKYAIENEDNNHFEVSVHQGSPLPGPERIIYVKKVASTVAETEARRRGWQNWDLNYVQDQDQGWMHIVIAEVARKNPVTTSPTTSQ